MAADDTFKVYIYDSTSGAIDIKESRLDFVPLTADSSMNVERANSAVRDLEDSSVDHQFFLDVLSDAYDHGMCGTPAAIDPPFFSHYRDTSPIIIMVTNEKMVVPMPPRRARGAPYVPRQEPLPAVKKTLARSFILAKPEDLHDGTFSFYVDLVCADSRSDAWRDARDDTRNAGKTVMQIATAYAISKGYEEVSLSSIPDLLAFYPKWGFEFRSSCNESAVKIPAALRDKAFVNTRDNIPGEMNPIYAEENRAYLEFMHSLRRAGLEHKHAPLGKDGEVTAGLTKDVACGMDLSEQ